MKWLGLVLVSVALFFFFVLPGLAEKKLNGIFPVAPAEEGIEVPRLHSQLFVSDLHADTLLWNRDIVNGSARGHVDLPRMQKGNMALQAFSVVTEASFIYKKAHNSPSPDGITLISIANRWPLSTWTSLSERALYQANYLKEQVAASKGEMRLILNQDDLRQLRKDRESGVQVTGAWLTIEGGHALEGDLSKLDTLYAAGFRMIGPVHLFDNELGASLTGDNSKGLTELGRQWIKAAEEKHIIIDFAHMSEPAMKEALLIMHQAPIVSHTGIKAVCPGVRNLSDEFIKTIAARDGIIGIGFWKEALCEPTISSVVKSIKHVCNLVGCQYVGLGSDWDGTVTTVFDAAHVGLLTGKLVEEGFTEAQIRGIMGENAYRFILKHLPEK
jgi:microsomal dipeptidase-like Zn-dependent dipeptidase